MTQLFSQKRLNGEEILERNKKWALNERELKINDELLHHCIRKG
jgi:hypothetical protein